MYSGLTSPRPEFRLAAVSFRNDRICRRKDSRLIRRLMCFGFDTADQERCASKECGVRAPPLRRVGGPSYREAKGGALRTRGPHQLGKNGAPLREARQSLPPRDGSPLILFTSASRWPCTRGSRVARGWPVLSRSEGRGSYGAWPTSSPRENVAAVSIGTVTSGCTHFCFSRTGFHRGSRGGFNL
jgi:hypothetical protein